MRYRAYVIVAKKTAYLGTLRHGRGSRRRGCCLSASGCSASSRAFDLLALCVYGTQHGEATSRTDSRAGRERASGRPAAEDAQQQPPPADPPPAPVEEAPPPVKPTNSKRSTRHWQAEVDATEYEHIAVLEHAGWTDEYECTRRAYEKAMANWINATYQT